MSVILSKTAHTHKSVKSSGKLMAVNKSKLRHALRKITIRMNTALIYKHSAGTVHRLNRIVIAVNNGCIHIVLIMIPVTRPMPQVLIQYNRGFDLLISVFTVLLTPEILKNITQNHSLRQEERKSRSLLINIKQIKLPSELSVITLFSFLHPLKVGVKLLLCRKCHTIDTLKHFVFTVALPVCSRTLNQLESLYRSGRKEMRTCAKVYKFAHAVEGNLLSFRNPSYKHNFIRFIFFLHESNCLISRKYKSLHTAVLADYLLHFLFDNRQHVRSKGSIRIYVIIKSIVYRRTDCQLCVRINTLHRGGQNVRSSMPKHLSALKIIKRERQNLGAVLHLTRKIDNRRTGFSRYYLTGDLSLFFKYFISRTHKNHSFRNITKSKILRLSDVDI